MNETELQERKCVTFMCVQCPYSFMIQKCSVLTANIFAVSWFV